MDKFYDIKNYNTFTKIEPINKGWSNDKKFYVETIDNENFLLRILDISEFKQKENESCYSVYSAGHPVSEAHPESNIKGIFNP